MSDTDSMNHSHSFTGDPRLVSPGDLIGAAEVCRLLDINRATVVRRVKAGTLPCLAKLDGPNGALVFDRSDITPLAAA